MRKLLLSLMVVSNVAMAANTLNMDTLRCRDMHVTDKTTLKQIYGTCLIKKQRFRHGMLEIVFRDDSTQKYVVCGFGATTLDTPVNGCRD